MRGPPPNAVTPLWLTKRDQWGKLSPRTFRRHCKCALNQAHGSCAARLVPQLPQCAKHRLHPFHFRQAHQLRRVDVGALSSCAAARQSCVPWKMSQAQGHSQFLVAQGGRRRQV